MTIRIVTDSTADLDAETIARHRISVVPLNVHFGDEVFTDGVTISKAEFYERLEHSDILPRTSQPGAATFQAAYAELDDADAIVSIHIGAKLSGTLNAARTGADLLPEGAPPVEVVDSAQTTVGLGYAVIAAAQAAEAGADVAGVVEAARVCAANARVFFFVDTLEYLLKGGRIGRARAFLGTLLRTRPVLELLNGEVEGIERPRTRQKAIVRIFQLVLKTPNPEHVSILYGTTLEDAEILAEQVRQALPGVGVTTVLVSPVVGVHTGPAALGAAVLRAPQ